MRYIKSTGKLKELFEKYEKDPMGLLYKNDIVTKDGKVKVKCVGNVGEDENSTLVKLLRGKYENDIADMVESFSNDASNVYLVEDERGLIGGFIVMVSDAFEPNGDWFLILAKGTRGKVSRFVDGVESYLWKVAELYASCSVPVVFSVGNWATEDESKYSAIEFSVMAILERLKGKCDIEESGGGYELYFNMGSHTKVDAWNTTTLVTNYILSLLDDNIIMKSINVPFEELGLGKDVNPKELVKTKEGRELLENAIREYMKKFLGDGFDFS